MEISSKQKESARLFSREEIPHAEHIFASTTTSISKDVKLQMFLSTIGQFPERYGK
jgi:hypothetical protein